MKRKGFCFITWITSGIIFVIIEDPRSLKEAVSLFLIACSAVVVYPICFTVALVVLGIVTIPIWSPIAESNGKERKHKFIQLGIGVIIVGGFLTIPGPAEGLSIVVKWVMNVIEMLQGNGEWQYVLLDL